MIMIGTLSPCLFLIHNSKANHLGEAYTYTNLCTKKSEMDEKYLRSHLVVLPREFT